MKDSHPAVSPPFHPSPASEASAGGFNILPFPDAAVDGAPSETWRMPVPGYVTSPYGKVRMLPVYRTKYVKVKKKGKLVTRKRRVRVGRRKHIHRGIDLKARKGDPIRAVAGGVVEYAGRAQGYGICVYLRHPDGLETRYAHASRLHVKTGDQVNAGTIIALAGSTGRSTGPHLHFEVRRYGDAINPLPFLEVARIHEEESGEEIEEGEDAGADEEPVNADPLDGSFQNNN